MTIKNSGEAEQRLMKDTSPLSEQELQEIMPYTNLISGGAMRRLEIELALRTIQAVQSFDKSSTKLSRRLLWLTWVLVILTGVITYFTILLAILTKQ